MAQTFCPLPMTTLPLGALLDNDIIEVTSDVSNPRADRRTGRDLATIPVIRKGTRFRVRVMRDPDFPKGVHYRLYPCKRTTVLTGSLEGFTSNGQYPAGSGLWLTVFAILDKAKRVTDADVSAILAAQDDTVADAEAVLTALVAKGVLTLTDVRDTARDIVANFDKQEG